MSERPPTTSAPTPWATLRLTLRPGGPRSLEELASAADRLAAVGTLLAEVPDVGGVEYRDPTTLGGATRPELWIYTLPDALAAVTAQAQRIAADLGLEVEARGEVRTDDDWRDSWKQFYDKLRFGADTLLVRPSWIARTDADPTREIVLDPGRAFGTGLHESTRLCLHRLCRLFEDGASFRRILDLGCGSGILGLAAARLWPQAGIVAMDNDPEATATTAENAADNGLTDRVRIETGTLADLDATGFDLLIANIRPEVLVPLAPAAREVVAPGGRVVLSGVLTEERAAVAAAWTAAGFVDGRADDPLLVEAAWCALDLDGPS